jgi:hypothetical protein
MLADSGSIKIVRRVLHGRILMLVIAVLFAGCSGLTTDLPRKKPESEDYGAIAEARLLLDTLNKPNNLLKSFKGTGKIKIWQDGRLKIDERVAWIGSQSSKLSIVILVSGHPAVKMSSDGKWFYYYEVRPKRPIYRKIPATDATLKRIISIPIKTGDVVDLMAGRIPLREHHSAHLEREDSGDGYVLVLKKRWWGVVEKIFLNETRTQVRQVEFFNRSGSLIYLARFDEMQFVKNYRVPSRLSISNEDGAEFQLDLDRYWADVDVSSSMFVLEPPD